MSHEVPVTQARIELAELVNRVAYTGEHVVLTRHGKPVAALVSIAELGRLTDQAAGGVRASADAGHYDIADPERREPAPLHIAAEHRPASAPPAPSALLPRANPGGPRL